MTPHASLPPDLGPEPFHVRRAHALGIGKRRLDGTDLTAPYRGVRSAQPGPTATIDRARAYAIRMPPSHVFSHVTAALIHGIPLSYRLEGQAQLHVTVPAGRRAPQMRAIVGHELTTTVVNREIVKGLRVTTPLQTWIDLGPLLNRVDLVAAADFLCAGRSPRYTPADLRHATRGLVGRRGCRALREAADLARARVDSPKETHARLFLLDAGLPEPIVNFEIVDSLGMFVARVDLSWPGFRVCVEYEGDGHRTDRARFRSDITRRERIEDQGWRLVRITDDDLRSGGREFVTRVTTALRARGFVAAEP